MIPSAIYIYVHDHLYSPVAVANLFGSSIIERYEYDAYGNCTVLDADFSADADGISDFANPYYFTGRRMDVLNDGDLKIMYYRNRYYDTETGRFLSNDPFIYIDGLNLYEYVRSNPAKYIDPFGLKVKFKRNPPTLWDSPETTGVGTGTVYGKAQITSADSKAPCFNAGKYSTCYRAKVKRYREWKIVYDWWYVKSGATTQSSILGTIIITKLKSNAVRTHEDGHIKFWTHWFKKYLNKGYTKVAKAIRPCACNKAKAQRMAMKKENEIYKKVYLMGLFESTPDHQALDALDQNSYDYFEKNDQWYLTDKAGYGKKRKSLINSRLKRSPTRWSEIENLVKDLEKWSENTCKECK